MCTNHKINKITYTMTVISDDLVLASNKSSGCHTSSAGKKATTVSDRENIDEGVKLKTSYGEMETDQESSGSSEDMESSPRSVVAKILRKYWPVNNKNITNNNNGDDSTVYVHSQILRIREEDSHIGEDMAETTSLTSCGHHHHHRHDVIDMWIISHRPILPASPLSGKNNVKSSHFH